MRSVPKALERSFGDVLYVLGTTVESGPTRTVRVGRETELGGNCNLVANRGKRFTN